MITIKVQSGHSSKATAEHTGARTFTYDPLGNLRQRLDTSAGPDISYAYDPFNRLQSMSVGLAFGYDGRGNTNSISGAGGTATMLYNHANELTYDDRGQTRGIRTIVVAGIG